MQVSELIERLKIYPAGAEVKANPQATAQNFIISDIGYDGDDDNVTPVWIFITRDKGSED